MHEQRFRHNVSSNEIYERWFVVILGYLSVIY